MKANLSRNRLALKWYYVKQSFNKEEEKEVIEDDFKTEKQSKNELFKRKIDFEQDAIPHMELLFNYALKISGNRLDAEDLLQDTYIRAYRFFHKFEKGTNCKAWLFRIMKNCFINKYRRDKKKQCTVNFDEVENFYDSIRKDIVAPHNMEFEIYSKLFDDELTAALSALKDDFKTVIILCDLEGLSYEETAEFVECPVGTVRSRLFRGRKLLQQKLYQYALSRGYVVENSLCNSKNYKFD
jgi:RNA polymerase sigma-70 factor, ECF subfamily